MFKVNQDFEFVNKYIQRHVEKIMLKIITKIQISSNICMPIDIVF